MAAAGAAGILAVTLESMTGALRRVSVVEPWRPTLRRRNVDPVTRAGTKRSGKA
jgi:hypothetical protein